MNREHMIAWCALEGWEPASEGRFYNREKNCVFYYDIGRSTIIDLQSIGEFFRGVYRCDWGAEHDEAFPYLLTELTRK